MTPHGSNTTGCPSGVAALAARPRHEDRVDDDGLVERSRAGDLEAFDQLVERHYASICAVARRLSPCPEDAADVAQEVFLAAWKQLRRFQRRASFATWLRAIALRQCALHARRASGRLTALDDPGAHPPTAPEGPSIHRLWETREQEAALHAAIQDLPRAQREAVALHYFGGLTCAETAAAMGISAGAVMTHLFRARKTLRDRLRWLADEEDSR